MISPASMACSSWCRCVRERGDYILLSNFWEMKMIKFKGNSNSSLVGCFVIYDRNSMFKTPTLLVSPLANIHLKILCCRCGCFLVRLSRHCVGSR
jgi:hypothetical protein